MEAYALLALHVAAKYIDNSHNMKFENGCGSMAAIQTYKKITSTQQDAAT